jgi:hypothetical protein
VPVALLACCCFDHVCVTAAAVAAAKQGLPHGPLSRLALAMPDLGVRIRCVGSVCRHEGRHTGRQHWVSIAHMQPAGSPKTPQAEPQTQLSPDTSRKHKHSCLLLPGARSVTEWLRAPQRVKATEFIGRALPCCLLGYLRSTGVAHQHNVTSHMSSAHSITAHNTSGQHQHTSSA